MRHNNGWSFAIWQMTLAIVKVFPEPVTPITIDVACPVECYRTRLEWLLVDRQKAEIQFVIEKACFVCILGLYLTIFAVLLRPS